MTPEEILNRIDGFPYLDSQPFLYPDIIEAMKEYARQERDRALDWAADSAEAKYEKHEYQISAYVDTESILIGKTHPDLDI